MPVNPFLGQIQAYGCNFAIRGWAFCDNQLLPISSNTALFSLLGTTFGGDGRTTFALPSLRGRVIRHVGRGPGLDVVTWGQRSGRESLTLTGANLPSHNHTVHATNGTYNVGSPSAAALATSPDDGRGNYTDPIYRSGSGANTTMQANAVSNTGGSQSVNILNPFLGIYTSIALQGIYPSRS